MIASQDPSPKPALQRGRFVVFEGGDGAGKTTQCRLLGQWLKAQHIDYIATREPGGTPLAEQLRSLSLCGDHAPLTELMLMFTARVDHLHQIIQPALRKGVWVVCDRFIDSTIAYQGDGLGIPEGIIRELHALVCDDLWPDLTITLDASPNLRQQRQISTSDGIEGRNSDFQNRMYNGFIRLAQQDNKHHMLINAEQSIEAIHASIIACLQPILAARD